MAQVQLADELGYDMAWLAELHFARRFSVMPAPLLMASALSQTTERIMLGTAVNLLPLHHPLRIAEEVATLDVLSGGRAVFGVGRGSNPDHYRGYGIPIEERTDRFVEGLDLVLQAWQNEELDYNGAVLPSRKRSSGAQADSTASSAGVRRLRWRRYLPAGGGSGPQHLGYAINHHGAGSERRARHLPGHAGGTRARSGGGQSRRERAGSRRRDTGRGQSRLLRPP